MARLNIEESCFGERRLRRLGELMGWNARETLGCLAYLWHDSQEQLRTHGTAAEIAEWCWAASPEEGARLVSALTTAGYLVGCERSGFLIKGNEVQIDTRIACMTRSGKGGNANKIRWEQIKQSRASSSPVTAPSIASSIAPDQEVGSSRGLNARQCKAMQGKSADVDLESTTAAPDELVLGEGGNGPPVRATPSPADLAKIWNEERQGAMAAVREARPGTRRERMAKARLRELPDLDAWRDLIRRVGKSPLCRGEVPYRDGGSPWVATFDWLVRPDTRDKIAEGNYDPKRQPLVAVRPSRTSREFTPDDFEDGKHVDRQPG